MNKSEENKPPTDTASDASTCSVGVFHFVSRGVTSNHQIYDEGMSLRDYFAAKALQGLLAKPQWETSTPASYTAKECYSLADEMIKARS